ncbi:phage integrase SAM-like domain-containing protein [Pontibacter sp. HSC-14F20]|uniref:phage integrase SAM-like domain-containing protein n=1 Tax=Pontibacter sp. HSC-14F20 TaxID=2864136 RepID=UPI001C7363CA|nr:phage integrase SAM-like domain-containing protein [Pontibacter sp. HSC-14F20]MBX0335593.1 phage integrase SAM-like domain-containing protein [Pontibacter sp. HSC-14F20]
MSFTVKGSLTAKKNKIGLHPLSIRYTIGGVPYNITLKTSDGKVIYVEKSDFDTDSSLMKKTKSNYNALNNLIRTHSQVLEDVATASSDKSFQTVKVLYVERLKEIKAEEERQAAVDKREETIVKAKKLHTLFSAEEAVEKKRSLTKSLTEIDKELEQYKAEGVISELNEEEELFKKLLLEFAKMYVNRPIHRQYKSWISNLLEFSQQTNTPLLFSQLDFDFYNKYGNYLMFNRMKGKVNIVNNTFGGQVKKLIQFVSWCRRIKKVKNVNLIYEDYPVFRKSKDTIIFLEDNELDLLYDEYRNDVSEAKQRLIDITVFQSCTGLRYGDIYASEWVLKDIDGEKVLTGITEKNDGNFVIPFFLDSRIEEILERYDYKMNHMVEGVYNREIKQLLAEFFKQYNLYQTPLTFTKERFDKKEILTDYKHNLFSSHCNRRRFINYWKLQGSEDQIILNILGSKDSSVLQGYKKKDIATTSKVIIKKLSQIKMLAAMKNEDSTSI